MQNWIHQPIQKLQHQLIQIPSQHLHGFHLSILFLSRLMRLILMMYQYIHHHHLQLQLILHQLIIQLLIRKPKEDIQIAYAQSIKKTMCQTALEWPNVHPKTSATTKTIITPVKTQCVELMKHAQSGTTLVRATMDASLRNIATPEEPTYIHQIYYLNVTTTAKVHHLNQ